MARIKAFACIRPKELRAKDVAALPYDVYTKKEAREFVKDKPLSFLRIDRAETAFDENYDMYSDEVYKKAKELLDKALSEAVYLKDERESYYIYELTMEGRSQSGIVACAHVDDYVENVIKKHEKTRVDKEIDRIRHIEALSAQTGPIFLIYKSQAVLKSFINDKKKNKPIYDFISEDGIGHRVWKLGEQEDIDFIDDTFAHIDSLYIADGHHRASSAVAVAMKKRAEGCDVDADSNYFLSVLFDESELCILPYNRIVKDLNGLEEDEFMKKLRDDFVVEPIEEAMEPEAKKTFTMYLSGQWYRLKFKGNDFLGLVEDLDVSILQDKLLGSILGITDPRTSERIVFVGGIKGIAELKAQVDANGGVAFSLYPTDIKELCAVSDADKLMPPKSTWFEPKLRSGLFIHEI